VSYDLAVWHSDTPLTAGQARQTYLALAATGNAAAAHPDVAAFYDELTGQYPEIDSLPDDQVDGCPWSAALTVAGNGVLMCLRWSAANEVGPEVYDLADAHGLVVFNPQSGRVHNPPEFTDGDGRSLELRDGSVHLDPDPALVEQSLRALDDTSYYLIVQRSAQHYVQVAYGAGGGTAPGGYALEWRDGSAGRHHRTELPALDPVRTAVLAFTRGDDTWPAALTWTKVDFDHD
jgi:hypothetical protein